MRKLAVARGVVALLLLATAFLVGRAATPEVAPEPAFAPPEPRSISVATSAKEGTLELIARLQGKSFDCAAAHGDPRVQVPSDRAVMIAGMKKAGTTALYRYLDDSLNIATGKEDCGSMLGSAAIKDASPRWYLFECHTTHKLLTRLTKKLSHVSGARMSTGKRLSVGGLIQDVVPIVIVRDKRQWAYSHFRFWCDRSTDKTAEHLDWCNSLALRTPRVFADVVRQELGWETGGARKGLAGWAEWNEPNLLYYEHVISMVELFGSVLVVSSNYLRACKCEFANALRNSPGCVDQTYNSHACKGIKHACATQEVDLDVFKDFPETFEQLSDRWTDCPQISAILGEDFGCGTASAASGELPEALRIEVITPGLSRVSTDVQTGMFRLRQEWGIQKALPPGYRETGTAGGTKQEDLVTA